MQVSKWGNSLAVRLPKKLVDEMNLSAGDEIHLVNASGHVVVIEKLNQRKAALARLTQMNLSLPDGYRFDRDEANER
jgi:antitoxin MazE